VTIAIGTKIDLNDDKLDWFARKVNVTHDADLEELEIAALARQAALEDKVLEDLEDKFADVKADWRDKIERQEKKRDEQRKDIARGKQTRVTYCDQVFAAGQIISVSRDSGEVVHVRPASPGEAQKALPADNGGLLADAARAQKESNVEEDEEGDVVPPDGSDQPKKRGKGK
jgi:hypothetical protein